MQVRLIVVFAVLILFPVAQGQNATQSSTPQVTHINSYGTFTGTLQLQPTGDGINMLVVNRYSYTDPDGNTLSAGAGFKTDGASIPRALWTVVGSPFTGKYIGAAVIHDVGCDTHKYSWQVTHRMFYTGMRALGVDDNYAKLLYWGVRLGGPKWTVAIVRGDSPEQVKQLASVLGATDVADSSIKQLPKPSHGMPAAGATAAPRYEAVVQVPIPQDKVLSDDEVKRFDDFIELRAHSAKGPISLSEIDKLTPEPEPMALLRRQNNEPTPVYNETVLAWLNTLTLPRIPGPPTPHSD